MNTRAALIRPPTRRTRVTRATVLVLAFVVVVLALAHIQGHPTAPGTSVSGMKAASSAASVQDSAGTTPDPTPGPSPSPGGGSSGSSGSGGTTPGTGKSSGSGSAAGSSGSKTGSGSGGSAATGPGKSSAPTQVPPANPNGSADGAGSGSVAWYDIPGQIEQAIDTWFGDLVKSALTPVLTLLGELVLATPNLTGGRISQIWEITLGIADTVFLLFVVIGGVIVMTHETVQSRYGLKQILPRLVFGFIAANTSLLAISQILTFGNAVTLAVWNTPLSGAGIGNQLLGYILGSIFLPDGVTQIFMILFGLVLAVLALAVVFSFAMRTAALLLLTVLAGPALLCHALPGLDAAAQLWWRALAAVLAIQFLQATVLMLILQVFFDPDSNVLGVPTTAGIVDLLVCGALFVILLKIPNWVMRMILGRAPRSTAMGLLRTAAMAAIGTAIGVPGAGSARMIAGRLAGKTASRYLGSGMPGLRSARAVRAPKTQRATRTRAVRPNFGTAHGRPGPGGQGALFPLPPGARTTPATASITPTTPNPQAPGGTSGPGWVQPPLFPAASPGPIRGRQQALFPIPTGAKRPRQNSPRPPVATPATAPNPVAAPTTRSGPRPVQPGLFPRSGIIAPPPVPRPVGTAPSAAGRIPQAPTDPVARVVPVRMAAAPPPVRKRGRRGKPRTTKGGEGR